MRFLFRQFAIACWLSCIMRGDARFFEEHDFSFPHGPSLVDLGLILGLWLGLVRHAATH